MMQPAAEVILLPEAAITGYDEGAISRAMADRNGAAVREAEAAIAKACRTHKLAAIVGTPYYDHSTRTTYNSATVIGPDGELVVRQHKLQLVSTDRVGGASCWWGTHCPSAQAQRPTGLASTPASPCTVTPLLTYSSAPPPRNMGL